MTKYIQTRGELTLCGILFLIFSAVNVVFLIAGLMWLGFTYIWFTIKIPKELEPEYMTILQKIKDYKK